MKIKKNDYPTINEDSLKIIGEKTDKEFIDNYDAINLDKVKEIPKDYKREMGVPISFIQK